MLFCMIEGFASSEEGVEIHYLDNEGTSRDLAPLVIVPGMMGLASFHETEMAQLLPRRVISITHRGLGKNLPIEPGQGSFAQRVSDIAAVVDHLKMERYFLYGFSRGVSLIVAHALKRPLEIQGLIIHDCEPTYPKISEKARDALISAARPHIPARTVIAYWQDSEAVDLTSQLKQISCSALIIRGEKEGSLLSLERAKAMKLLLKNSQLATLPNSAHELSEIDRDSFVSSLQCFMSEKSINHSLGRSNHSNHDSAFS